jgi:4-carboxymuconolactone decarboxylase
MSPRPSGTPLSSAGATTDGDLVPGIEPTLPRIAPVSDPDEDQRARLAKTPVGDNGQPLNLFATLAHRPRLLTRVNSLGSCLMFGSVIPARERELVILRTAGRCRCAYEVTHHRSLGAAAGLTAQEIEAALDSASSHPWSVADRALLRVTDELVDGADVSDAAWADLERVLDDSGRVELLVLVGFYRMLAGLLNGARVEVDALVMSADGVPRPMSA